MSKKYTHKSSRLRDQSKRQLSELGVRPSKERGQNFLVNDLVIDSILEFGKPSKSEFIIEIGPGLGALTSALIPYDLKAVIEIEKAFASTIQSQYPQLKVYEQDARYFDFSVFEKPVTIFSNLPYSISSEMLLALVKTDKIYVKRIVLMLQKEFVERLSAEVSSASYGILSVFCQRAARLRTGPIVPAECFQPKPKIDSQLIALDFYASRSEIALKFKDQNFEDIFTKVVRAAFSKRRKTLINSLQSSGLYNKEFWNKVLCLSQIDSQRRAQTLSWQEYELITACILNNL